MIRLTAFHYKLNVHAQEVYHNINELAEAQMFAWKKENEQIENLGGEYQHRPFIEQHEFKQSDYDIMEIRLRVRKEDIMYYKENEDNLVEVTLTGREVVFVVKEPIEYLDKFF